ncbi:hypothetical protein E4K67_22620 [Desulfosporosinus fructosivorans]|uniref:Uncharacterized protein n=1 Tax=Desulfosporosinus fructosivorans TaxID=2018669 RepID=A0A4Z0R131_9FIRM|nr:hypothetical protein [Desulfosporosinus fructosivorans]TGE35913.1 hypothetical protein E4K67_22620 [Desulfosporosinus fructosivorans]
MAKQIQRKPTHNSKSKAKTPCKCLICANSNRVTFEGRNLLICGDEACDLKRDVCTERPISGCGFKPMPVVVEVYEGERMQA